MTEHTVVSQDAWLAARRALLAEEKALTRRREALAAARRDLPWVRVDKAYRFTGPDGSLGLGDLFGGRTQLIVQHFMFGPDWEAGCPSCSLMADHVGGTLPHLAQRDIAFVAVSRAPIAKIDAYRNRMGWSFPWVSSEGSDFNFDYGVSFTPEQIDAGDIFYNFAKSGWGMEEMPGISVFRRDGGAVFHTYSTYGRGLEDFIGTYDYFDITPRGRDETGMGNMGDWAKRHDEY